MSAQVPMNQPHFIAMAEPPALPAITQDVLPGEGSTPGKYTLRGPAVIFDTWKPRRHRIATLKAGTPLVLLSGVSEVSKPDLVAVTSPVPELQLNPGDSLLRYTWRGEGNADFWAKGRFYRDLNGEFVTEADGSGCQSQCKARVVESGLKVWWFRVRLMDHRIGWTNAADGFNPN